MNVVLLGHRDIASLYAMHRLMRVLPQHRYRVCLSGKLTPATPPCPALQALADFDARLAEKFLRDVKSDELWGPAAEDLSQPNSAEGLRRLEQYAPDVLVSIRYRRILREPAIGIPRHGVLNLHSGILPDYKGVMATFWAMLQREDRVGCTLHRIVDRGIDTGPILGIERLRTRYDESYLSNVLRLYGPGCDMLAKALRALEAGATPATYPQPGGGRYYATPTAADLARFAAAGLELSAGAARTLAELRLPPAR